MVRSILLIFLLLFPGFGTLKAAEIDLSSARATYESCYSDVKFETPAREVENRVKQCLTPTAQKALFSYAVLGAYFLDNLKDSKGQKKYPGFLNEIMAVMNRHELLGGSRMAFQQGNLPAALGDVFAIYAAHPYVLQNFSYSERALESLEQQADTARGVERFQIKARAPSNALEINFVKIQDEWLIHHIAYLR